MKVLLWVAIACVGALAVGAIALNRGEPVNSFWLILAAVCIYLIGFRFYSKFIAARVMALDDNRATPAERLRNGHDYEPTNKWIVFGHHFAAIAGPGPLVGPVRSPRNSATCPERSGFCLAACWAAPCRTSSFSFASLRRDGKSLGADGA